MRQLLYEQDIRYETILHQGSTSIFTSLVVQHSYNMGEGTNIFAQEKGQILCTWGDGGYDEVDYDEEVDVSEANIFVCKGSKLFAGVKILEEIDHFHSWWFSVSTSNKFLSLD